MLHFSRFTSIIGAPLILATLLACVTPAGAMLCANGIFQNGVWQNGVYQNGLWENGQSLNGTSLNGSALGDLNGVAVEAVIIWEAAR